MEDQQAESAGLTDATEEDTQACEASDVVGEEAADESAAEPEPEDGEAAPAPKRRARRWAGVAAGLAAALFVGSAAFAGASVQPYLADRAVVATKVEVVRTATAAMIALFNYTPENIDTLVDRAEPYLSGDFASEYRKMIDQIAGLSRQQQITKVTEITGAAVESLAEADAAVLIYTNTSSSSPLTKNIPSLLYYSHRVLLHRDGSSWRMNGIITVTNLDLTAQL